MLLTFLPFLSDRANSRPDYIPQDFKVLSPLRIFCTFEKSMAKRLEGKVCVVTGSTSGLGRAISLAYAKEGALLVCSDVKPTARSEIAEEGAITTHELIKQQNGQAVFVTADVSVVEDVENLISRAVREFGRVDV